MRKILFKAKRVDNGEWVVSGSIIQFLDYGIRTFYMPSIHAKCTCTHDEQDNIISFDSGLFYKIDPNTVCQFTGLTDKNGREIFEGDIVKSVALNDDHHQRGAIVISPVEYFCGNACLSITHVPIYPFCISHDIEIIGSIHDTPNRGQHDD